jgi:HSP90 family molecular chaperone
LTKSEQEVFAKAIEEYGRQNQLIVLFEEMSELQKEVCKSVRYKTSKSILAHVAEEIADVSIMLDQTKMIFNISDEDVEGWRLDKVVRLRERLGLAPMLIPDKGDDYVERV